MAIEKLTVGVLLVNSTIVPMAKNFNMGLKRGLKELSNHTDMQVEIVPEFIGQGSKDQAEAAVNKLIGFDDADVLTGIISNKVSFELSERIAKHKRPFIINNIGEHLPDPSRYNNYTFLNSVHTWQQLWSMGKWAVATFGKKGMYISGIYDCGYSFQSMLGVGMEAAANDTSMPFAIAPARTYKGLADVASVFQHIQAYQPDFVMATFCGDEAKLFLEGYISHGFHKTIPLLGLPFLLESFTADDAIEVFTTISLKRDPQTDEIDSLCESMMNPFTQFGYETGLLITAAVMKAEGRSLQQALAETVIETDRGLLEVMPQNSGHQSKVFLIKNIYSGDKAAISRQLVGELETIDIDHETVKHLNNQPSSGWMNPYLGI